MNAPDIGEVRATGRQHWSAYHAAAAAGDLERAEDEIATAVQLFWSLRLAASESLPAEAATYFAYADAILRDPSDTLDTIARTLTSLMMTRGAGDLDEIDRMIGASYLLLLDPVTKTQAERISLLPMALAVRAMATGMPADFDRTLVRLRRVQPANHTSTLLSAVVHYLRGQRTGSIRDVDEAISLFERALKESTAGSRAQVWTSLSEARYERYLLTSDPADLGAAIAAGRSARERVTPGDPLTAGYSAHVARMLRARYSHTGDAGSLDEAVEIARVAMGEPGAAGVACRAELGRILLLQAKHYGLRPPLDEAITLLRAEHADRGIDVQTADALAAALVTDYEAHTHSRGDHAGTELLDEAIDLLRRAIAGASSHTDNAVGNLGAALAMRHQRSGAPEERDEAIALLSGLIATTVDENQRARARRHLADLLAEAAGQRGAPVPPQAVALARAAAGAGIPAGDRIGGARAWARLAERSGDLEEAVTAYRAAIGLLPELVPRQLRRGDQQRLLAAHFRLAGEAAATALDAGRLQIALELLEQGRGVLQAAAINLDRDLADLRRAAPGLAARLASIRQAQQATTDADRRHQLVVDENALVDEIRRHPGLARFQRPPDWARLRDAAAGGPVVTINVAPRRCDALILKDRRVRVVSLTALHADELAERATSFAEAVRLLGSARAGLLDRLHAQETVQATLEWLWDTVTGPVLGALALRDPPVAGRPLPRLWWIPTGALAALPLHAAGPARGPNTLDLVVSSYTPTLRALVEARREPPAPRPGPRRFPGMRGVVVTMSRTPGHADLPGSLMESAEVLLAEPGAMPLVDDQAFRRQVLGALAECGWAHFACHAFADAENPSASHLLLHDQPLTVTDIHRLRLPGPEFAYLSACSTARSSETLAGEALHPGAAFQLAGFRNVVATLWPVEDEVAAAVARVFYARRSQDGVARALNAAGRAARDAAPRSPSRWAAHLHIGP